MPDDVREVEANLFVVFQGWTPDTTARMSLGELMNWHEMAIERNRPQT